MIGGLINRDRTIRSALPSEIELLSDTYLRKRDDALVIIGIAYDDNLTYLQMGTQTKHTIIPRHVLGLGDNRLGIVKIGLFELRIPR